MSPVCLRLERLVHPLSGKSYGKPAGTTLDYERERPLFLKFIRKKRLAKIFFLTIAALKKNF